MRITAIITLAASLLLTACAGNGYDDNGYRAKSPVTDPFKPRGR